MTKKVAPGAAAASRRCFHVGIGRTFQQQLSGANPRQILFGHTDAAIGRQSRSNILAAAKDRGSPLPTRCATVPARRYPDGAGPLAARSAKRSFSLGVLVGFRELYRLVERSACFRAFLASTY